MGSISPEGFVKEVLQEPLTKHRAILSFRIREGSGLSRHQLDFFLDSLEPLAKDPLKFAEERIKLEQALMKGSCDSTPYFETPETQLLWAAGLTHIHSHFQEATKPWDENFAGTNVTQTPIWQQMIKTPYAIRELTDHMHYITEALQNPKTAIKWGPPGSWFYYLPEKNIINDDFLLSLAGGFEHTRAVLFHEIGHSQLTVAFPKRNQEIFNEMRALDKKKKEKKLTKDEYKKLRLLSAEWNLRHQLNDKTENQVVNRYTANMGKVLAQNYAHSLNHYLVTIGGLGYRQLMEEAGFGEDTLFSNANDNVPKSKEDVQKLIDKVNEVIAKENNPQQIEDLLVSPKQLQKVLEGKMQGKKMNPLSREFNRVASAVDMSFFKNNKLFKNTRQGWLSVGIDPDKVLRTSTRKGQTSVTKGKHPQEDLQDLLDMCGHPTEDSLENLQPKFRERHYGADYFRKRVEETQSLRNEIMERIWDEYLADLAEELLKQEEERIENEMQQQQQQQDGQDGDDGDPQDGQDGQDGQEGQEGQSNSQSQSGGQGQGQGQSGKQDKNQKQDGQQEKQKGDKQQPQKGDEQDGQQDAEDGQDAGQEGDEQDQDGGGAEGQDADENGQQGQDEDGASGGEDTDEQDMDGEDGGAGGEHDHLEDDSLADLNDGKTGLEDGSEMQDVNMPPEEPETADGQPGQDGDGQDGDGSDGQDSDGQDSGGEPKTLEELMKELEEAMQQDQQDFDDGDNADGQDGQDGQDAGDGQAQAQSQSNSDSQSNQSSQQGGDEQGTKPLSELAKESWTNYMRRVAQLMGPITHVSKLFAKIKELQLEKADRLSRSRSMLPEKNELDRLNKQALRDKIIKQKTGQPLKRDDYRLFQKDEEYDVSTTPDLVIMIDGSGSMTSGSNPNPMELAVLTSAILYEAGKKAGMNVYVTIWGDQNPKVLVRPGDTPHDIGKNLEAARKGLGSGTNLAPSFKGITEMIAEQKIKAGAKAGYTHVLVVSDGDISDLEPSRSAITTFLKTSKFSTIDFALIRNNLGANNAQAHFNQNARGRQLSRVHELAKLVTNDIPSSNVKIAEGMDPNKLPMEIVGMVLDKIRSTNSFTAIPHKRKRQLMRRTRNQLK